MAMKEWNDTFNSFWVVIYIYIYIYKFIHWNGSPIVTKFLEKGILIGYLEVQVAISLDGIMKQEIGVQSPASIIYVLNAKSSSCGNGFDFLQLLFSLATRRGVVLFGNLFIYPKGPKKKLFLRAQVFKCNYVCLLYLFNIKPQNIIISSNQIQSIPWNILVQCTYLLNPAWLSGFLRGHNGYFVFFWWTSFNYWPKLAKLAVVAHRHACTKGPAL
jgi:hypothetical protein